MASTADDEAMARMEQEKLDMELAQQLANELDVQERAPSPLPENPSPYAALDAAANGGEGSGSKQVSSFAKMMKFIEKQNKPKSTLIDMEDGSKDMEAMGSLLYLPCEINGRVVEMMVDRYVHMLLKKLKVLRGCETF